MVSNFVKRSISGFLIVAVLTGCIFISPVTFFVLFLTIISIGICEFARMAATVHIKINRPLCILSGCLLFAAGFIHNHFDSIDGYLLFILSALILGISELYRKQPNALQNLALGIYSLIYIALPFTLLTYFPHIHNGCWNPAIVFFPFLLVWFNDTFAYLFGVTLGRHKLFPRISPKKSWEGAIGGGLTTIIAAYLITPYIGGLTATDAIAISAIVVVFGNLGDLIESMFKRCIEIKDSGHILPGHGGILDRFDSILYALPAIFIYLMFAARF